MEPNTKRVGRSSPRDRLDEGVSRHSAKGRGQARSIDPSCCENDYSAAELEFLQAISDYKNRTGRLFPTWGEVLEVLHRLGYAKIGKPDVLPSSLPHTVSTSQPSTQKDRLPAQALSLMTGLSEDEITNWSNGILFDGPKVQLIEEMYRLFQSLTEVVQPGAIVHWLENPSEEFNNLTPLQILRRGESERIRSMIFDLEAGMPI